MKEINNLEYNIDFLKAQYVQCNEHLRESDRKRDLLFGLYITLTVAYYSIFNNLTGDNSSTTIIIGLSLFGSCLGVLFTLYRGWHGVYIIMIITIQNMIANPHIKVDGAFIKKIDFQFNLLTSVELFVFLMLNALTVANTLYCYLPLKNKMPIFIVLFSVWFAQFILHFFSMNYLDRQKKKSKLTTKYLWLLQGTVDQ